MLSAAQCIAKAEELSDQADCPENELVRRLKLLVMAHAWLDVSAQAEWQNARPLSPTYRIQ
jgi:hypothetical protein